jgi:hypothetical protein
MTLSVPDTCDQFIDKFVVFDPVFRDFGALRKFHGARPKLGVDF